VDLTLKARLIDLARHRLFVTSPAVWPTWPFLALVRCRDGRTDLGVLFDARGALNLTGFSSTVLLANLYDLPDTLAALLAGPKEVFDTSEELIDAGWRVD
jgi:hypothetical protein